MTWSFFFLVQGLIFLIQLNVFFRSKNDAQLCELQKCLINLKLKVNKEVHLPKSIKTVSSSHCAMANYKKFRILFLWDSIVQRERNIFVFVWNLFKKLLICIIIPLSWDLITFYSLKNTFLDLCRNLFKIVSNFLEFCFDIL